MTHCPHRYFERVESLLRRSLGVSQAAKTRTDGIKPAPPVAQSPLPDAEEAAERGNMGDAPGGIGFEFGENGPQFMDWSELKSRVDVDGSDGEQLDDIVEEALSHDEL